MQINKVSIVGMGALGLLYANHIAKHAGSDTVSFVMDEKRIQKYRGEDFSINGEKVRFQMISDTDATPADLLIVAVKYTGLEAALDVMKSSIDEHTIIMSVMNGISSEEIIGNRYGMDRILYTVAQGMDAMKFTDEEAIKTLCEKVKDLSEKVGITQTVKEVGAKKEDLEMLAEKAMEDPCKPGNPREVSKEDFIELFKQAM